MSQQEVTFPSPGTTFNGLALDSEGQLYKNENGQWTPVQREEPEQQEQLPKQQEQLPKQQG